VKKGEILLTARTLQLVLEEKKGMKREITRGKSQPRICKVRKRTPGKYSERVVADA